MSSYVTPGLAHSPIIDDATAALYAPDEATPDGCSRGYAARDYGAVPYASQPYTAPFDLPLIPRDEWPDRIEEMDRTESSLGHLMRAADWRVLNQGRTNFCWINCVAAAMEVLMIRDGGEVVKLSPASVGGPMKGYRNVGHWPTACPAFIAEHGIAPAAVWPPNEISRRRDNPETRAARAGIKITEWWDVVEPHDRGRAFDRVMTLLLNRIPVAVGLNWWRHAVLFVRPVMPRRNEYGVRGPNSWGPTWNGDGWFTTGGRKATPDDATAPRVIFPR